VACLERIELLVGEAAGELGRHRIDVPVEYREEVV